MICGSIGRARTHLVVILEARGLILEAGDSLPAKTEHFAKRSSKSDFVDPPRQALTLFSQTCFLIVFLSAAFSGFLWFWVPRDSILVLILATLWSWASRKTDESKYYYIAQLDFADTNLLLVLPIFPGGLLSAGKGQLRCSPAPNLVSEVHSFLEKNLVSHSGIHNIGRFLSLPCLECAGDDDLLIWPVERYNGLLPALALHPPSSSIPW